MEPPEMRHEPAARLLQMITHIKGTGNRGPARGIIGDEPASERFLSAEPPRPAAVLEKSMSEARGGSGNPGGTKGREDKMGVEVGDGGNAVELTSPPPRRGSRNPHETWIPASAGMRFGA